jgi:hypothetical protein
MEITKLEIDVLTVFYDTSMDCCFECSIDENMSYNNVRDVAQALNLSEQQVGGVFASLVKKDLIVDLKESPRGLDINDFFLGDKFFTAEVAKNWEIEQENKEEVESEWSEK